MTSISTDAKNGTPNGNLCETIPWETFTSSVHGQTITKLAGRLGDDFVTVAHAAEDRHVITFFGASLDDPLFESPVYRDNT